MPELNLGPPPSSSKLPAILTAACVMAAIFAAILYFNPHKTADLTITRVQLYAAHTITPLAKGGSNVVGALPHADDDLYVLLNVKLTDKSRLPLFIKDETLVLTAPDHSILEASAIQKNDLANLYTTFPQLQTLATTPLARDTQIDPNQSAEGMVLLHFAGATADNWNKRDSATLTIALFHGEPQVIKIP